MLGIGLGMMIMMRRKLAVEINIRKRRVSRDRSKDDEMNKKSSRMLYQEMIW